MICDLLIVIPLTSAILLQLLAGRAYRVVLSNYCYDLTLPNVHEKAPLYDRIINTAGGMLYVICTQSVNNP